MGYIGQIFFKRVKAGTFVRKPVIVVKNSKKKDWEKKSSGSSHGCQVGRARDEREKKRRRKNGGKEKTIKNQT